MKTMLFCLVVAMVCGQRVQGEEREWTISYTTQAELVEVRGGTVFLKAGDAVQSVPLEQLSDSDRQYVASLPLAPVAQSVASDQPAGNERLPVPGTETAAIAAAAVEPASFSAPPEGPALLAPTQTLGGERSMLVAPPRVVTQAQAEDFGNSVIPTPAMTPNAANQFNGQNGQNLNGTNGRRLTAAQQNPQRQNQGNGANQKRSRDDSRPGLLGGRQRRLLGDRN